MLNIKICSGTSCYLKGAYNVIQLFQHEIENHSLHEEVEIIGSFCLGKCENNVSVEINGQIYNVAPETAIKFFRETVMPLVEKQA